MTSQWTGAERPSPRHGPRRQSGLRSHRRDRRRNDKVSVRAPFDARVWPAPWSIPARGSNLQHRRVGPVALAHVSQKRKLIASSTPCSTPMIATAAAVTTASLNSPGLSCRIARNVGISTIPIAIVNTIAASTQRGKILKRAGERQQNDEHASSEHDLRELTAGAGAISHRGLRRAAIDHERAADCRGPLATASPSMSASSSVRSS